MPGMSGVGGMMLMPKIVEQHASALNMDPAEYKATLLEMMRAGPKGVKRPFDWYFNLIRMVRDFRAKNPAPALEPPMGGGRGNLGSFGSVAKQAISAYKSAKAGQPAP